MKTTEQNITIGTKVSYEDMANPRCAGDVTGHWTVKLVGEASEEQAEQVRENWRRGREVRDAA